MPLMETPTPICGTVTAHGRNLKENMAIPGWLTWQICTKSRKSHCTQQVVS